MNERTHDHGFKDVDLYTNKTSPHQKRVFRFFNWPLYRNFGQ